MERPLWSHGFRPKWQAAELIASLRLLAHRCSEWHLPCVIAKLDLKKAFDTIPLALLFTTLYSRTAQSHWPHILALETLYQQQTTDFSVRGATSDFVQLLRGVRQGCTGSPFLFSVAMDWLLEHIQSTLPGLGITLDDMELMFVSYADDIYVATTSVDNLHTILAAVTATLAAQNMELNHAKTQWCSTRQSDQRLTLDIGTARLAPQPRHLGLPILGTMVSFDGDDHSAVQHSITRAWRKYWELSRLLLNRRLSLRLRCRLLDVVVLASLTWGLETVRPTTQARAKIDRMHHNMVHLMVGSGLPLPAEPPGEYWRRTRHAALE
eukprot:5146136-Amphidinium_carterae.1